MWEGRFGKALDQLADDFNSSLHFDCRMFRQDIKGSVAHAQMLSARGIISEEDCDIIVKNLLDILEDIESGKIEFSSGEDIHMFVEEELTKRTGDVGKRLHTARSRNDQVALDIRLYLRDESREIVSLIKELMKAVLHIAQDNKDAIMPGYTHLQRAQPITFGHHLMAYAMMLERDVTRIEDAVKRMNYSPLGSCALAGTTYSTDRNMVASALGFDGLTRNSIDGVSDRDFCVELMSALSLLMMHLSRFSEEIILWSSWEFKFVELDDAYTTGSSIMPQKKNPDGLELVRAKAATVSGYSTGIKNIIRALPSGYNRDFQETKEILFKVLDTAYSSTIIMKLTIDELEVNKETLIGCFTPDIFATDEALRLVAGGMSFRDAYKQVGLNLDKLSNEDPVEALKKRTSTGTAGNLNLEYALSLINTLGEFVKGEKDVVDGVVSNLSSIDRSVFF